eukprot:Phypoly_transcript_01296.p2 GENE.Phypoly_transcript_01296~~Phypoly_transcript_01296.p2  ORF type:complete len:521 (-),score=104.86 Phypoly_transcript_01296:150-1712(-)
MSEKRKRDLEEDGELSASSSSKNMKVEEEDELMDTLDLHGLKRLVLSFERKINKNQQMRIKFSDQPEKFMDSEVDLDEEIKKMHIIATAPSLYAELVKLNSVPSMVALLGHENADISIDIIDLLHELLDVDAEEGEEDEEGAHSGIQVLVESLIENQGLEVLVQNLSRFDETQQEDAQAVFNSFSIIENLIEYKPSVATLITEKTNLMTFLLNRVKAKQFDGNRLYASEILAILLQNSKENQRKIGEQNGIDTLLMAIAAYKKHDPHTGEEAEMLENIFNSLCSSLLLPENRSRFMRAEGLELMIIIMKNKKLKDTRRSALKVISFALTRNTANCRRFVDVLGLKTLFSVFMKTSSKGWTQDDDEHVISCISTLLLHLDPKSSHHDRVLGKFKENEFEKVERMLELHEKYFKKVLIADKKIAADREALGEVTDEDEDSFYLERLDAGLYVLQLVDVVIAAVSTADAEVKNKVMRLFDLKNINVEELKNQVNEYINSVGDAMNEDDKASEHKRLHGLTSCF